MFKPRYGICICHNEKRLIVVKKGLCKQGNDERKRNNNNGRRLSKGDAGHSKQELQQSGKSGVLYSKVRKLTGMVEQTDDDNLEKREESSLQNRKKTKQVFHRKKGIVRKKKVTGERVVFEEILEERGRYSQISGQYLGEGFNPWWFSHVVPKSIAPGLRLDKRNIILKTHEEHATWENKKHTIRCDPKWKWVFELEGKLKQEYYGKGKTKS